jgi:hypothetical protein
MNLDPLELTLMNPEYEHRLATAIDRELKRLPEVPAPPTLLPRVLRMIEARARLPWYRKAWQGWPTPWRVLSLVLALTLFGGFCFGSWQLMHTQPVSVALHRVGGWLASLATLLNVINVLLGAVWGAMKHLGTGFIVACLASIALGYTACVGLGSVYFRLAFARRQN